MCVIIMHDDGRMQVEVSKHTEGTKEKMLRPNGLPESLIRYDGTYSFFCVLLLIIHSEMTVCCL